VFPAERNKIQGWGFPIPEDLRDYFFFGGSAGFSGGAGFSGAFSGAGTGAGASAGFGFSAGFSSAFLQPTLRENEMRSISDRSMTKNFFINGHLLSKDTCQFLLYAYYTTNGFSILS